MMLYSLAFLALLALGVAPGTNAQTCGDAGNTLGTIVDIACAQENAGTFGTLCLRLRNTGLDDALTPEGDFFVFAPDNTAFSLAGTTAGVSLAQQKAVLEYHVSVGSSDLVCGTDRTSILTINNNPQTHTTQCSVDGAGTLVGQAGDVRIPTPSSGFPLFTGIDPPTDFIQACNGVIAPIGGVLGFDTAQYSYGGCSFYDPFCGGKGSKGGFVTETVVNGVAFDNVYYNTKKGKGAKGYNPWSGFNQYQTVYANDAFNAFSPYFRPPYYGGKQSKRGYYGGYYGGYYRGGFNNGFYGGGFYGGGFGGYYRGGKGGKGGYWYRNRKLEKDSIVFDNGISDYEPEEYYEYEVPDSGFPEQV